MRRPVFRLWTFLVVIAVLLGALAVWNVTAGVQYKAASGSFVGAWAGLLRVGKHGYTPSSPGWEVSSGWTLSQYQWLPRANFEPPTARFIAVPIWMIAAGIGVASWCVWRAARRGRGRCAACGYSRQGLGVDAPCPECGARSE
jgi:hypothetical protein